MLRKRFSGLNYEPQGHWVLIPNFQLPEGWEPITTSVVFQIQSNHPSTAPYGIYVPSGLMFKGTKPIQQNNYVEPSANKVPFSGIWGMFSWAPVEGQWFPKTDIIGGSNLLNWVLGFSERFREGL